jgi:two-component system, chemotaxis family, sensor kinase CheA
MVKKLLAAVVLPSEITSFEREYLRKMNRVALVFFALHVPLFTTIAFFNKTNPVLAAVLTLFGLAGPVLAQRVFSNPRIVSTVFGVTAMFMGALLVHFGRGMWTIEMHFYFFVALALLAVFANPTVIIAATVTVAAHHFVLWFISPTSVFNYDAPLSSVLLHALFVVVEAVAASFVARSFFDNVIGLERIVSARTAELDGRNREMQLVFDHVNQGFLTVDAKGALAAQHSRVVAQWFKAPVAGQSLWDFFGAFNPSFAQWLKLGWDTVIEGVFPLDVALAQLPASMEFGERHLSLEYQPVCEGEQLTQVLVLVTDVTERRAREAADVAQRETMAVFERLMRDRAGFLDFFAEAKDLVGQLDGADRELALRHIHTLKGNCALFGMGTVSDVCHHVETRIAERNNVIDPSDFELIRKAWASSTTRVLTFLEAGTGHAIELDESDYAGILQAIDRGAPRAEVLRMIESWRHEPVKKRFERMSEQAQSIAARLGKGPVTVSIDAAALRLPRERFASVWSSATHLLRNAIDHGLRPSTERHGHLDLSARVSGGELHLAISDNGDGIDWDRVASQAKARGLPSTTRDELVEALFANGLSTRDEATELSGRGVGMGAVRASVREAGGTLLVSSEKGHGTKVELVFPATSLEAPRSQKVDALHSLANGSPEAAQASS